MNLTYEELQARYQLVCRASQPTSTMDVQLQQELQKLESLINRDLIALSRQGCPDNITDILRSFDHELTRFRQFCEFPQLATKSIIGIGGGFSTGKSSFINKLIGKKCLAVEVDPTTSMPAYVMKGNQEQIKAINLYNCAIDLTAQQLATLTHEEKEIYGSQVGLALKAAFLLLTDFQWQNLAILDTPGYSKPEDSEWNERTDENLARDQLNTADYILWAVQADSGTISEQDIKFLNTIDKEIPKLVILTRADKKPREDIESITTLIKSTLTNRGISIIDVVPFSRKSKAGFPLDKVIKQFDLWDQQNNPIMFAQHFKKLFIEYQNFIESEKRNTFLRMDNIKKILVMSEESQIVEAANVLLTKVTQELEVLAALSIAHDQLNNAFFIQLKKIGDLAGVPLPEPSSIELMDLKSIDLLSMLEKQMAENKIDPPIRNHFSSIKTQLDSDNKNKLLRLEQSSEVILNAISLELRNRSALLRLKNEMIEYDFDVNSSQTSIAALLRKNEYKTTIRF
ncbi:dynamin family protein [Vibrio metschnikovii]|uniref:Dynamin family protein n=2 Tax=Unclassified Bacteria TaxID=49928 RepID=A0AAU6UWB2_UNCXX|nr:dynamin family protein [Vibrio metschnikovii]